MKNLRSNSGIALPYIISIIFILSVFTAAVVVSSTNANRQSAHSQNFEQMYYNAESILQVVENVFTNSIGTVPISLMNVKPVLVTAIEDILDEAIEITAEEMRNHGLEIGVDYEIEYTLFDDLIVEEGGWTFFAQTGWSPPADIEAVTPFEYTIRVTYEFRSAELTRAFVVSGAYIIEGSGTPDDGVWIGGIGALINSGQRSGNNNHFTTNGQIKLYTTMDRSSYQIIGSSSVDENDTFDILMTDHGGQIKICDSCARCNSLTLPANSVKSEIRFEALNTIATIAGHTSLPNINTQNLPSPPNTGSPALRWIPTGTNNQETPSSIGSRTTLWVAGANTGTTVNGAEFPTLEAIYVANGNLTLAGTFPSLRAVYVGGNGNLTLGTSSRSFASNKTDEETLHIYVNNGNLTINVAGTTNVSSNGVSNTAAFVLTNAKVYAQGNLIMPAQNAGSREVKTDAQIYVHNEVKIGASSGSRLQANNWNINYVPTIYSGANNANAGGNPIMVFVETSPGFSGIFYANAAPPPLSGSGSNHALIELNVNSNIFVGAVLTSSTRRSININPRSGGVSTVYLSLIGDSIKNMNEQLKGYFAGIASGDGADSGFIGDLDSTYLGSIVRLPAAIREFNPTSTPTPIP
jgi:hypothetical protein